MTIHQIVLRELLGGLWHTTRRDRFDAILLAEAILPEPNIPNNERWSSCDGPELYPYVRAIGGVSLFDFDSFEPDIYSRDYPLSSWAYFVPYHRGWRASVWIEIDRHLVAPQIISSHDLAEQQRAAGDHRRKRMPEIEVAHLGPLPRLAFKRAFFVREGDAQIHFLKC